MRLFPLLLSAACACPPEEGGCPEVTLDAAGDTLRLDRGQCGSLDLQGRVLGEGELDVDLSVDDGAVVPTISGSGTFEGLVLEGEWALAGDEPARLWRQGYQSWSWAGVVDLSEPTLDADGVPEVGGDGDATSATADTAWSSWWVGLVGRSDGQSLVVGGAEASVTRFFTALSESRAWAVWGHRGEQVAVEGTLELDPLLVDIGAAPQELLAEYASVVAARREVELPSPPPTGWATWYQFYSEVTEQDVISNLGVAADLGPDLAGIEVFQLDDGWQVTWGEWTAGDDFPSGMAALAREISDAGFVPGLWMAPFYVSREAPIYALHDDWWVREEDGEELSFTNLGTGDYAVIDATHPDAGAWMAEQVAARVDEGWAYLKLDFLYAGAQEGRRYTDVTGMEAYRVGLGLLREAAGDSWVLACGAPMLPTVGYADSFRTGSDIAYELDPDPRREYLRWQARATAARGWTNGRWWWIDPDQVLVREPLSEEEARGAVVAQAVSGGPWLLGDDLASLPDERIALALDPDATALRGLTVTVDDPLAWVSGHDAGPAVERFQPDDQAPQVWRLSDGTVALLNLSDEEVTVDSPGGVELLTGEGASAGERVLEAGEGELWRVDTELR